MTLLITAAGPAYSLACSDQRITAANTNGTTVLDEQFNKHIVFGSIDYGGSVCYTGLARWRLRGKTFRLYDLISEAIAKSIVTQPTFAQLCLDIWAHLVAKLPNKIEVGTDPFVELHIVARHKVIPVNTITVLSNFRTIAPWGSAGGNHYEYELGSFRLFLKAMVEESDVIFGGMDHRMSGAEKAKLRHVIQAGGNAFQCAELAARTMEAVAKRTPTVGPRCAAVVHPRNGYVDTNLWRRTSSGVNAFLPRMIMPNGAFWGPSHFPASLPLSLRGQLPEQSLFYKAVIASNFKKRIQRIVFSRRKGPLVPSLMGFIGLMLFGQVMPGYEDFGLGMAGMADNPSEDESASAQADPSR
jgi:hypothetical protein